MIYIEINEAKENSNTTEADKCFEDQTHPSEASEDTDFILSQADVTDQSKLSWSPTPVPPIRKKKKRGWPPKPTEAEKTNVETVRRDVNFSMCSVYDDTEGIFNNKGTKTPITNVTSQASWSYEDEICYLCNKKIALPFIL